MRLRQAGDAALRLEGADTSIGHMRRADLRQLRHLTRSRKGHLPRSRARSAHVATKEDRLSYFARFFSRRSGKTAGAPDAENWQVGDWAECIHMGQWRLYPTGTVCPGPRHGRIGRVTGVTVVRVDGLGQILGLSFAGWPGEAFAASAFRKVNPRADEAVAAETEFTALVRRPPAPVLPRETIREFQ
jgi:hypothetical protein